MPPAGPRTAAQASAVAWYQRFALPLVVLAIGLLIFTLTRIGLALYTGLQDVAPRYWPGLLWHGLLFDLATLAWLLAPVFIYEVLLPHRLRRSRLHRALRFGWLWLSVFLLVFGAFSEVTFWIEFATRFNFIAVDYLIYTQEVLANIQQSYPVGPILAGVALLALLVAWPAWRWIAAGDRQAHSRSSRLVYLLAAVVLPALSAWVIDSDQMRHTDNEFANELAGNGLYTFAAAFRRNELDYDRFYATLPQVQADAILKSDGVQRAPLGESADRLSRPAAAAAAAPSGTSDAAAPAAAMPAAAATGDAAAGMALPARRPRNVVMISVESLSASYVGAYGDNRRLTPRLDALAAQGLMFERLFATGTRTVRGLEALSLGTPPVPGQAIVRRPNNDHLATVGTVLRQQGFETFFFYGGYGYFDNMNAYFAANDYQIVDRTDIPSGEVLFENAWGVADEVLFNHALTRLDATAQAGKPFFAQVMTTSNHRPYTYPDGRIDIPSPGGRDGAVKYTDYAIGKFIDDARSHPWFKDTLFVIVADHCASVSGRQKLPVANYHIPMVFYGPDIVGPARYKGLASQIDLPPTLLQMLGASGTDLFYGQPLFGDKAPGRAFVSNYQELGLYRDDELTILLPRQKVESFRIDPASYDATPSAGTAAARERTIAYYQTASRAFKLGALRAPAPAPR